MKLSRETMLIISVILLLFGLTLISVQKIVLTSDTTLFLARQTKHPALAAKDSMDALIGTDIQVTPLTVPISVWYGRSVLILCFVIFLKNSK